MNKEKEEVIEYSNDSSTIFENDVDEISVEDKLVFENWGNLFDFNINEYSLLRIGMNKMYCI